MLVKIYILFTKSAVVAHHLNSYSSSNYPQGLILERGKDERTSVSMFALKFEV